MAARLEADGYDGVAEQVARLARFEFSEDGGAPLATVTVPGGVVRVLAGGGFDPEEAARRRAKRRAELEAEMARVEAKLANERFVERAPAHVVEGERAKLDRLRGELDAL